MLLMGETPNDHKAWLFSMIRTNKDFIKRIEVFKSKSAYIQEVVNGLRAEIKTYMAELTTLERWRMKRGLEHDQPYIPPSYTRYVNSMTTEEQEGYAEWQATMQTEIDRLEHEYQLKHGESNV